MNVKQLFTLLILFVGFLASASCSICPNKKLNIYGERDYATALKKIEPLAEEGNAEAQFKLGTMYQRGDGVARYHKEAVRWYRLAAGQGHAEAQFELGVIYSSSNRWNQKERVKWYTLAAEQGHAEAQFKLSVVYERGEPVDTKREKESMKWLTRAAEQGYAKAQSSLGYRYHRHRGGVARDYKKAVKWYTLATEAFAKQKNVWKAKYAQYPQEYLGSIYDRGGHGVAQDYKKAVKWFKLSAENGNSIAQYKLATMYKTGRGVPRNYILAYMWAGFAIDSGTPYGARHGTRLRDNLSGKITPSQITEAEKLALECVKKNRKGC